MMTYGYTFYFEDGSDLLTFPITPGKLSVSVGSNNKVITLINEGDVNILKSPSLTEIEFEARFPMRQYPFSRKPLNFEVYYSKFMELKNDKKVFRFIVARDTNPSNQGYGVDYEVSLEDLEILEDANEGDDILVSFKLKQYKPFGIKTLPQSENPNTTSTSEGARSTVGKDTSSKPYTIQPGDCLWNIAKAMYGDGSRWKEIYEANRETIEAAAKKHGKESSRDGHWIYPGVTLTIPGINEVKTTSTTSTKPTGNTSGNGASTDTSSTTTQKEHCTFLVYCNGIDKYAGVYQVNYTYNGVQTSRRSSTENLTITFDKGTHVVVIVTDKKDCSHTVSLLGGNWYESYGRYARTSLTTSTSMWIKWVGKHGGAGSSFSPDNGSGGAGTPF